ncbi:MAG: hypothetical protein ACYTG5_12755, partial [Planctomycetota bacterium]
GIDVEPQDKVGFTMRPTGDAAPAGLSLQFPSTSRPCITLGEDGVFVTQEGEFSGVRASAALIGHSADRFLLEFSQEVELSGKLAMDGYDLQFKPAVEFELMLVLDEAARQARELLRQAREARSGGLMQLALQFLQEARSKFPHDEKVLGDVEELRREITGEMEQRIATLREGAADASFFRSKSGYRRIRDGILGLIDLYGPENLSQVESLRSLATEMGQGLAQLESLAAAEHRSRLELLEAALRDSGQPELADLVAQYLKQN